MQIPVEGKLVKSAGCFWQPCWPLISSSVVKLLGLSGEQVTGNHTCSHCVAASGSPCFSSLFLAVFISLSFAGLDAVKPKRDLLVPQKVGKGGSSPALPFLARGILSIWEVPSWP